MMQHQEVHNHPQKHPVERHIQALDEAYKVHNALLATVDEMDSKIQQVIRCHEGEFLIAYRNHIKNMKQELAQIKLRSQQQQKKMMSNQRSVFLQKQIILFRQQAIRLYDKLQQKIEENDTIKTNLKEMEKVNHVLEKQNKAQLREIRILETQKNIIQVQLEEINQQKATIQDQLEGYRKLFGKHKLSQGQTTNTNAQTAPLAPKFKTPKQEQSFLPMPVNSISGKRRTQPRLRQYSNNKMNILKQRKRMSTQIMDHEVKNWFIQCMQTIRRQIGQRKVYGNKSDQINNIGSWQQFRMIDKLRLLEMFMQNQKLLVWMYQKIFPNRFSQIQSYFQVKKTQNSGFDSRSKSKSMNINLDNTNLDDYQVTINQKLNGQGGQSEKASLPKVQMTSIRSKKQKKYDVRSRIEMKNGKLNLSQVNNQYQS